MAVHYYFISSIERACNKIELLIILLLSTLQVELHVLLELVL